MNIEGHDLYRTLALNIVTAHVHLVIIFYMAQAVILPEALLVVEET